MEPVRPRGARDRAFRAPARGRKKGPVELYMEGRYFTVTGAVVAGSPPGIREIPDPLLKQFFRQHFEEEQEPDRKKDAV